MEFFKDLWGYMKARKTYWLLPIILTLLLMAAVIFLAGGSALSVIFYTIF